MAYLSATTFVDTMRADKPEGGTYRQEGDYLLPNIEAPESPQIGIWGQRRHKYLMEHNRALYTALLLSGKLTTHLEEIDRVASKMYDRLV